MTTNTNAQVLNKNTKTQISKAIQNVYICAFEFNKVKGDTLDNRYYQNQFNITMSEIEETVEAIRVNDMVEVVDGLCDSLFTGAFLDGILTGSNDITKDTPSNLNSGSLTVEDSVALGYTALKSNNVIDFLGHIEDACEAINFDIVSYMDAVCKSNYSKFTSTSQVTNPEEVCRLLEGQGRYSEVYFESSRLFGEEVYLWKSKRDLKMKEDFPRGKLLKSPLTFKEPSEFFND